MNAYLNKEQGERAAGAARWVLKGVRALMCFVDSVTPVPARASAFSTALVLLALAQADSVGASTEPTNARAQLDYTAFKLIAERNIFNAHRSTPAGAMQGAPRRPPRIDTLTLVGTLSYEKGQFAFFEGSSPEYRKVLKVAESIAGYQLTDIQPASVKLVAATGDIQLAVGRQLRREEGSDWRVAEQSESTAATSGSAVSPPTTRSNRRRGPMTDQAPPALSESGWQSDFTDPVLVPQMEEREQETNK